METFSYKSLFQMTETICIPNNISKSKEEGKYQETIQSSTTPDTGHHME